MPSLVKLFGNHVDAWGLTFTIGSLALVLHQRFTADAIALVVAITICYWLGFAVNDYFDAPFDAHDARKATHNFFVTYPIAQRWFVAAVLLIAAPTFTLFAYFGAAGVVIFGVGLFVLWAYSAPPLRFKSRPGLDLATHAVFVQTFPYFVCLYLLQLPWTPLDWLLLSLFLLGSLSAQLEQQARDYELDCRFDRTFTTRFGLGTTAALLRATTIILIVNVAWHLLSGVIPDVLVPFGLICIPLVGHRLIRDIREPRSEKLIRLTLIAVLAYASVIWGGEFLL
ncbi:MAG: UbiA family prenyltransferase [Chloroflexi bacterium]|nr:UbiA family prenyltransferase [Chloroflexota bacterium]